MIVDTLAGVVCVLVVAGALLLTDTAPSPQPSVQTSVGPIPTVAPSTVLTEQPYIGAACPAPAPFNAAEAIRRAITCDRIGLAIQLRTRAVGATATINGESFKLDNTTWSDPPVAGKHKALAGFLQHAGFVKHGPFAYLRGHRVTVERVHLLIYYGAGHELQTSLRELGYGGWG